MQQRNDSLDALRGFAILAMVLASSIAFSILPAWMYHAQEPPPAHMYNPSLPGITWVDLVFPFFLFSMGAAIPLALHKKLQAPGKWWKVPSIACRRFCLLVFFAFFTFHLRANVISANPGMADYLLSVTAFFLLFIQLYKNADGRYKVVHSWVRWIAFAIAAWLLYYLPSKAGSSFDWSQVDIIILVLANMAFFGTIIWWLTKNNYWMRLGLLPFVMALFLSAKETGSWNEIFYNWTPFPAIYKFYYLKYLFLVLPGTIAGDWILQYGKQAAGQHQDKQISIVRKVSLLSLGLIIAQVSLLFLQYSFVALLIGLLGCGWIYYFIKQLGKENLRWFSLFFAAGTYLLLLGLFFNAYEGGIKKDPSTFSYYFVTGGLAFFTLMVLYGIQATKFGGPVAKFLSENGRNPMVAYVAGNLLLLPILHMTGGIRVLSAMEGNVWMGFLRGVLFTGIVSAITVYFTRRKWFWKT